MPALSSAPSHHRTARTRPARATEHALRGKSALAAGRLHDAIRCFEDALAAAPDDVDLALVLAKLHGDAAQWRDMHTVVTRALQVAPNHTTLVAQLADALRHLDQPREALAAAHRLCELSPDDAQAWSNFAAMLVTIGEHTTALRAAQRALSLDPTYTPALINSAEVFMALGDDAMAYECLTLALTRAPGHAQARLNRAILGKRLGRWDTAWQDFEARFDQRAFVLGLEPMVGRRWQGESLAGKSIVLFPEQGLGDELTFARFIAPLAEQGAHVTLRCSPSVAEVLATAPGVAAVSVRGTAVPEADFVAPLLSLPLLLSVGARQVHGAPYLAPMGACPPAIVDALDSITAPRRIGLVWFGNAAFKGNHTRSIGLEALRPMLDVPDTHVVSLQMGDAVRDLERLSPAERARITDLSPLLTNFNATAHALRRLDLLIASDTSVPNLAGALGVPTWLLASTPCDFRWNQRGERTPWYDSVRVFRQPTAGDWSSVAADVVRALSASDAILR
jgi:tetratricopeptide (TPR) repeat protein